MRKLIVLALLLVTALLAAPPAAVQSQEEEAKTKVELLEAGAEPRIPLRYKFQAGHKESMLMDMKMSMQISMQGMDQPAMDMPVMRMVMDMTSDELTEEGHLKYSFEVTEATVLEGGDPFMAESMRMGLESAVGMKGWAVVDSRGITQDGDFEMPPDADPQTLQSIESMKQNMSQMSAPLPEEPVGAGATWKVTMPMDTNGISFKQVATYKLVSLSNDVAELELTLDQRAEKQNMDLPNLPPGVVAELESLNSSGTGWSTLDLTKLVPTSSVDLKMNMSAIIKMDVQEMPMSTKMDMGVKISPRAVTETPKDDEKEK